IVSVLGLSCQPKAIQLPSWFAPRFLFLGAIKPVSSTELQIIPTILLCTNKIVRSVHRCRQWRVVGRITPFNTLYGKSTNLWEVAGMRRAALSIAARLVGEGEFFDLAI